MGGWKLAFGLAMAMALASQPAAAHGAADPQGAVSGLAGSTRQAQHRAEALCRACRRCQVQSRTGGKRTVPARGLAEGRARRARLERGLLARHAVLPARDLSA